MNPLDLSTIKYAVPAKKVTAFRLVVVEGPTKGHVFDVPTQGVRALVGTAPSCTLVVADPHASRRHFSAIATERHLEIYDLGSSNGTLVNGVRVSECACLGGELIRMGGSTLRVDTVGTVSPQDEYFDTSFGSAIGNSFVMRQVFAACERAAASDVPLVIEGETGTGKELLAENIHRASARGAAGAPLIVFDTAMAPDHALAEVLFGSEGGEPGLVEQAHGGTLVLRGVTELSLDIQRRLQRVFERGEVQRVGSPAVVHVRVRPIVLTSADLDKAVEDGLLREDLLRLLLARIEIPPLRKRREDIAPLVALFWSAFGSHEIPAGLVARFESQAWPGNVTELQAAVGQYLATGEFALGSLGAPSGQQEPGAQSFSAIFEQIMAMDLPLPQAKQRAAAEFEREYVTRVLAKHGGNVSRAAAASGIAHRYFQLINARHRKS